MAYNRAGGPRKGRKKVCVFCVEKVDEIDYKDVTRLKRFVSERSKILPRRVTGTCAKHQRAYYCYQESKTFSSSPLHIRLISR